MAKKHKTENTATRATSLQDESPILTAQMPWTDPMPPTNPMPWITPYDTNGWERLSMSLPAPGPSAPGYARRGEREVTGEDLLSLARQHVGEKYVHGARAPMANPGWKGPWDCAEFVTWCVYQASGILFGTEPRNDPMRADAYTGYWAQQARAGACTIPVEDAVVTVGAALLRYPQPGAAGHIVFSDGENGTLEAHSSKRGVIASTVNGRRWDTGVLVPGVRYYRTGDAAPPKRPKDVMRLTHPLTRSKRVAEIQEALNRRGYMAGSEDGIYGPQTAHAVVRFQAEQGLVPDGEVGSITLKALAL